MYVITSCIASLGTILLIARWHLLLPPRRRWRHTQPRSRLRPPPLSPPIPQVTNTHTPFAPAAWFSLSLARAVHAGTRSPLPAGVRDCGFAAALRRKTAFPSAPRSRTRLPCRPAASHSLSHRKPGHFRLERRLRERWRRTRRLGRGGGGRGGRSRRRSGSAGGPSPSGSGCLGGRAAGAVAAAGTERPRATSTRSTTSSESWGAGPSGGGGAWGGHLTRRRLHRGDQARAPAWRARHALILRRSRCTAMALPGSW